MPPSNVRSPAAARARWMSRSRRRNALLMKRKVFSTRGRLGHHHQHAEVRDQEEVERDEARARRQIADQVVDVELAHLVDAGDSWSPAAGWPPTADRPRRRPGPGPSTDVSTTQSSMRGDALVEEVAQRHRRAFDADEGVQVGAAEIGVDEHDALAQLRQVDGQVGREQRLADAALAATDGDDAASASAGARSAFTGRRVFRLVCVDHDASVSRIGAQP